MKKVIRKVKHWLIKKLGGCLPYERTVTVLKTTAEPITVYATHETHIDYWKSKYHLMPDPKEEAVKQLCYQISQELFLRGLCDVKATYDSFTDKTRFVASVVVIPEVNNG